MLKEYSEYYFQASTILHRIECTLEGLQFHEKDLAVEVFAAQAVSMSRSHCRAVSLLLDADLFSESIAICRSLFELCFDLVWIHSTKERQEKLERIYKLEADPYFGMDREVKRIEEDVKSVSPLTSEEKLKQFKQVLDRAKQARPYLTVCMSDGNAEFKRAPPLVNRMSHESRLLYYHIYRFMCLFTHPSPMLKELHLQNVRRNRNVNELIEGPLKEVLADSLLFVEIITKTAVSCMVTYAPHKTDTLTTCCEDLVKLTEKRYKGYLGTSEHKKPDT